MRLILKIRCAVHPTMGDLDAVFSGVFTKEKDVSVVPCRRCIKEAVEHGKRELVEQIIAKNDQMHGQINPENTLDKGSDV